MLAIGSHDNCIYIYGIQEEDGQLKISKINRPL